MASNAKDQCRSRSVLPTWGDIYRLRDLPSAHVAALRSGSIVTNEG